jgi:hypothetical protein
MHKIVTLLATISKAPETYMAPESTYVLASTMDNQLRRPMAWELANLEGLWRDSCIEDLLNFILMPSKMMDK